MSPGSQKAIDDRVHAATVAKLEAKGIPVLGKDGKSFDQLMEEKMRKMGKTWKNGDKSDGSQWVAFEFGGLFLKKEIVTAARSLGSLLGMTTIRPVSAKGL